MTDSKTIFKGASKDTFNFDKIAAFLPFLREHPCHICRVGEDEYVFKIKKRDIEGNTELLLGFTTSVRLLTKGQVTFDLERVERDYEENYTDTVYHSLVGESKIGEPIRNSCCG